MTNLFLLDKGFGLGFGFNDNNDNNNEAPSDEPFLRSEQEPLWLSSWDDTFIRRWWISAKHL
jgi:hypothetical protein